MQKSGQQAPELLQVSRHWCSGASQVALATAQRMLPPISAVLRTVAGAEPGEDTVAWEVRAAALLDAMSLGYRHWAATPGSDLLAVVTDAVDTVLPILQPLNADGDAQSPTAGVENDAS